MSTGLKAAFWKHVNSYLTMIRSGSATDKAIVDDLFRASRDTGNGAGMDIAAGVVSPAAVEYLVPLSETDMEILDGINTWLQRLLDDDWQPDVILHELGLVVNDKMGHVHDTTASLLSHLRR